MAINSLPHADTAPLKWDVSRQVKVTIKNPGLIPNLMQPGLPEFVYKDQPKAENDPVQFPVNPVEGNDDAAWDDEDDNPYRARSGNGLDHAIAELSSADAPGAVALNIWGAAGRLFANIGDFREFARVELWDRHRTTGTFWYRISDHVAWHFNFQATWDTTTGQWVPSYRFFRH